MKRWSYYMLAFGCGLWIASIVDIIEADHEETQRRAAECPLPDEDRVSEQAAVCERVCGTNRIKYFDPGPWASHMVCSCKP